MSALTITRLARASGVRRETIRFYEQRGLISAPPRSAAGYRLYSRDEVRRVRFIKSAQALGFSLEEIADLLALRSGPAGTCAAVKARAEAKIADIERRIAALAAMKTALADIAAACDGGQDSAGDCPILAALDAEERGGGACEAHRAARSTLTCPHCGHRRAETMPPDACLYFYDCRGCGRMLRPASGDCCVFCTYGDAPCPPMQLARGAAGAACCAEKRGEPLEAPGLTAPRRRAK